MSISPIQTFGSALAPYCANIFCRCANSDLQERTEMVRRSFGRRDLFLLTYATRYMYMLHNLMANKIVSLLTWVLAKVCLHCQRWCRTGWQTFFKHRPNFAIWSLFGHLFFVYFHVMYPLLFLTADKNP